jgi:hypothetical protein
LHLQWKIAPTSARVIENRAKLYWIMQLAGECKDTRWKRNGLHGHGAR